MQYLGSKQRIAGWIVDEIDQAFPETTHLVDLMSGSGAISHEANMRGWDLHVNDIQPYSHRVLKSAFGISRDGIEKAIEWLRSDELNETILSGARASACDALALEDKYVADALAGDFDWREYAAFCENFNGHHAQATGNYDLFTAYYPNTYFGIRQCLEIDTIREKSASYQPNVSGHIIGALISGLTFVSSTTTHLAQYLKPTSQTTALNLITRRSKSVQAEVLRRLEILSEYPMPKMATISNLTFEDVLSGLDDNPGTVVYADPPYFKEHYSRYYHVLDTLALYDYPELTFNDRLGTVTVGRYRSERIISDFGLRSKVADAFSNMFNLASDRALPMAVSYASTSLLSAKTIVDLAASAGYRTQLKEIKLRHSGQGQSSAKSDVTEYLFLLRHDR